MSCLREGSERKMSCLKVSGGRVMTRTIRDRERHLMGFSGKERMGRVRAGSA